MSLRKKFMLIITGFIVILMATTISMLGIQKYKTDNITKSTVQSMTQNSKRMVGANITDVANNIANFVSMLEIQIEKNMINAANVLKEADRAKQLTNEDLAKIAKQTGMTDLYLADKTGVFVNSTEKAAIGFNLFSIWDGYKRLVDGRSTLLPSNLTIKAETGEIFKFVAIPRADGKGIVQSALNAEIFEKSLETFLHSQNGVQLIYLFDESNVVLTENLKMDRLPYGKKGDKVENEAITNIFKTMSPKLNITDKQAEMYYPIMFDGKAKYVIYTVVDTKQYFSSTDLVLKSLNTVNDSLQNNIFIIILINVIIAAILLLISIIFINSNLKPLTVILNKANKIAEGDLTADDDIKIKGSLEITKLSEAFYKMASNLKDVITRVSMSTEQLAASSEELTANAEGTSKATEDVSATIQEVAQDSLKQSEEIKKSVNAINEMAASIEDISNNANNVSKAASETNVIATEGNKVIKNAIVQMNHTNETVSDIAKIIKELGNRSNEIESIILTITNIAEQTNLLALNAAIEAARAGESGRGFAVVADEVRKLAEQSGEAAKQISALISSVQSETTKAVDAMEVGTTEMYTGINSVQNAGQLFEEIQISIDAVAGHIKELSETLNNMNSTTNTTVNAINVISTVTEDIAFKTESIASTSEEQSASMSEITSASEALSKMSEELEVLINTFKL